MIERRRRGNWSTTKARSTPAAVPVSRSKVFGPAPLIEGEDPAAYDELLARVLADAEPADILDEMYIADVVSSEWDILRVHRLKSSLLQHGLQDQLELFLREKLEYYLYAECFVDDLAKILQDNLPEDQAKDVRLLARNCAHDDPDANAKVDKVLAGTRQDVDDILDRARVRRAKELVVEYIGRKPRAVEIVNKLLSTDGTSIDKFGADAFIARLDTIERLDRLAAIAQSRRDASLREIERRRLVLGERLRRTVHDLEEGEFKSIEATPGKGKSAA